MFEILRRNVAPALAVLAFVAGVYLIGPPDAHGAQPLVLSQPTPTIEMIGTGTVHAQPDTAFVNSGVVSTGRTARDAVSTNTAAMNKLLEVVAKAGIDARDVQTSNLAVSPLYDGGNGQQQPRINGYQVSNQVTIRVRDLTRLGDLLDDMIAAGGNVLNGVSLTIDDPSKLYDEARKKAFADALGKATVYAEAAGMKLDAVHSITEGVSAPMPMAVPQMMRAGGMEMAAAAPVPVQAGQLDLTVNVDVTWNLGNP